MQADAALLWKCYLEMSQSMMGIFSEMERSKQQLPIEELVDSAFVLKMVDENLKQLRTRIGVLREELNRKVWIDASKKVLEDQDTSHNTIRTPYVTCSVGTNWSVPVPSRKEFNVDDPSPRVTGLLDWLGIPREAMTAIEGFHYRGIEERLTQAMENGDPMPDGYLPDQVIPAPRLTFRGHGKKPILEALGK